jgi:hypothetical protein
LSPLSPRMKTLIELSFFIRDNPCQSLAKASVLAKRLS